MKRACDDLFFDNDEKVTSSWKHTHIKATVQKRYPIYDQNGQHWLNGTANNFPPDLFTSILQLYFILSGK